MPVLSSDDLTFWQNNGYIVVPNAVPQAQLDAVVDAMWEFLEMDRNNPADWNTWPEWHRQKSGMVQLFHHQSMWDVRQNPHIHEIFSDIYQTEKLWVSLDRLNMNPPALPDFQYEGVIHWDINPREWPAPLKVGGVLCLTDTAADQGGFQCIPGSHLHVTDIVNALPPGHPERLPPVAREDVKSIPGKAGDLIIWNVGTLHSNSRNRSAIPRLAQYITMTPAEPENTKEREYRINVWRNNLPPYNEQGFVPDPRGIEEKSGQPAQLTALGRKLLGMDSWE